MSNLDNLVAEILQQAQKELTEDKMKKLTELDYINEVKFADRL